MHWVPKLEKLKKAISASIKRVQPIKDDQPTICAHSIPQPPRTLKLLAYSTQGARLPLLAATHKRLWMDDTEFSFANRCLPLKMANHAGWVLLNDRRVEAHWNGGRAAADLHIQHSSRHVFETSPPEFQAVTHFGHGILTWRIPYLFRTPPGYNLYVRGPTNWWKDGATALDALVETDWAVATFTMNWKITRVNAPIVFEKDDPICMVFPFPRGLLEQFVPEIHDIREDGELFYEYSKWKESRQAFNDMFTTTRDYSQWQKHYFAGKYPDGCPFLAHQVKLDIASVNDTKEK